MFLLRACALFLMPLATALAQSSCVFYLSQHSLGANNTGVSLDLESGSAGSNACQTNSATLVLAVGNGTAWNYTVASPSWQLGHLYTAIAVVTAAGATQLFLDGQLIASGTGALAAGLGPVYASQIPGWGAGPSAYTVTQTGLQIQNGSQTLSLPAAGYVAPPVQNVLLGGPPVWDAPFAEDPAQTLTLQATFELDAAISNPLQYDPYIDAYGQSNFGAWPSKVASDSELLAALTAEQNWLADNPPIMGLDPYGGSTIAGWNDTATGYYRTAFHNNRWWLISPLGNPEFYISLSAVGYGQVTPVTGREAEFALLPPTTGLTAAAYSQGYWGNDRNMTYVRFDLSNLIRKYGGNWAATWNNLMPQRLASWGFAGVGKWTGVTSNLPSTPVLSRGAVPNVVSGGHPDVFDPSVVAQLKTALATQMEGDVANPYIVGWTVGSELSEDIEPSEVQAILDLGASVPVKQALVNQALAALYGGDLAALAQAWGIAASTVAGVYAASPTPPPQDIESLRQYYEQNYYRTIYQTIKGIDPNHLYLGNWVDPFYWVNPADWTLIAANTDVIGFDYYTFPFHSPSMDAMLQAANKPVMIGEFSFPSNYDGQRGFGSNPVSAESDAAAGAMYSQWLQDTSASAYCVGVSWFEYGDEPVSGRGPEGSIFGAGLVYGEDYAFGLVDIADQPKYDLVTQVRAANIAALRSLGLLESAPAIDRVANAASGVTGAVAPGEYVSIYGGNLGPAAGMISHAASGEEKELGGVKVLFGATEAYLAYASATQLNVLVPYSTGGPNTAVQVTYNGAQTSLTVPVANTAPGILTTGYGPGPAWAVNSADGTWNSAANPAAQGSYIQIWATGQGAVTPAGIDGAAIVSGQWPVPTNPVTAIVGAAEVAPSWVGLVFTGEIQVNVQIPNDAPVGSAVPLQLTIGGVSSRPDVTVSIKAKQ